MCHCDLTASSRKNQRVGDNLDLIKKLFFIICPKHAVKLQWLKFQFDLFVPLFFFVLWGKKLHLDKITSGEPLCGSRAAISVPQGAAQVEADSHAVMISHHMFIKIKWSRCLPRGSSKFNHLWVEGHI